MQPSPTVASSGEAASRYSSPPGRQRPDASVTAAPPGAMEVELAEGDALAEEQRDGLVLAEDLKEALGALRERARGIERFFRRLADAEQAATKAHRRAQAKARELPKSSAEQEESVARILFRIEALLEQRITQGESLAGVWGSEQRRWAPRGAAAQEARRRIEEDTRQTARELCSARQSSSRLLRKHEACRAAAIQALRARGAIESRRSYANFATACAPHKHADRDLLKKARKAESAFRDHVLTRQALTRHAPGLRHAEEEHRAQIRAVLALSREAHTSFCRDLKESLQLTIGSLNVFSQTMLDVHSELGCAGANYTRCTTPSGSEMMEPIELRSGGPRWTPFPGDVNCAMQPASTGDRSGNLSSEECPTTAGARETGELSEALRAKLEIDRAALRALQVVLAGVRDAEDQVLRTLALGQLPAPAIGEPERIAEAGRWLQAAVQTRIEAAGAASVFLVEQLLPALQQQLTSLNNDLQLVEEEQRRTAASINQASRARQQKLSEVPSLADGRALVDEESELIFCSRMARILEEVRQRAAFRAGALGSLVEELLDIEHGRWHARICETAQHALRRLAASDLSAPGGGPPWWPGAGAAATASGSGSPAVASAPSASSARWPEQDDTVASGAGIGAGTGVVAMVGIATGSDEALLAAEEKRVKGLARATGDFSGRDGFAFRMGDEVQLLLQVGEVWLGVDPRGVTGEFPPHLVEVEGGRGAEYILPTSDHLVALFKKDVLENGEYVPSAEDEEFTSRFAEYLDNGSTGTSTRVLASYSCALLTSRKVPLQGRLYATAQFIGFFSHFSETPLKEQTVLLLRTCEIARVEKRTNALIFQNSIEVSMADGSSNFFSSFVDRDGAFEYLTNLRSVCHRLRAEEEGPDRVNGPVSGPGLSGFVGSSSEVPKPSLGHCRALRLLPTTACAPYPRCMGGTVGEDGEGGASSSTSPARQWCPLKHQLPGRIFEGVDLDVIFDSIFRDFEEGSFYAAFEDGRGARASPHAADTPPWSPMPPAGFAEVGPLVEGPPQRRVLVQRPVRTATWMKRMAKISDYCDCVERWVLHSLGKAAGFFVEVDSQVSGIPYSDYFSIRYRFKSTLLSDYRIQVDAELELDWHKSTLLQSRIEESAIEDFRNGFENVFIPLATRRLLGTGSPRASATGVVAICPDGNAGTSDGGEHAGSPCQDSPCTQPLATMSPAEPLNLEVKLAPHGPGNAGSWPPHARVLVALAVTCCTLLLLVLAGIWRLEARLEELRLAGGLGAALAGARTCAPPN